MLDAQTLSLLQQLGVDPATAESVLSGLLALSVVAVVATIPTAMIARRKARSVTVWVLLALSIPVIPLLLVWWLPALEKKVTPGRAERR